MILRPLPPHVWVHNGHDASTLRFEVYGVYGLQGNTWDSRTDVLVRSSLRHQSTNWSVSQSHCSRSGSQLQLGVVGWRCPMPK